ncbi:MAG: branched-chain amino acid aminotransferase, partial [bacterium]
SGAPAPRRRVRSELRPSGGVHAAREVFLTNSVQEVLPVRTLDGRALPERGVALRLLAAYREQVAAD